MAEQTFREVVDYELFQKMKHLDARCDENGDFFCVDSCCDYFDSLVRDGDRFGVVVFVEPCGNLTKWGASWSECMDWWMAVFSTQPASWSYITAGWHLYELHDKGFPDAPADVWPNVDDACENVPTGKDRQVLLLPGIGLTEEQRAIIADLSNKEVSTKTILGILQELIDLDAPPPPPGPAADVI